VEPPDEVLLVPPTSVFGCGFEEADSEHAAMSVNNPSMANEHVAMPERTRVGFVVRVVMVGPGNASVT
jgi:hypothetical protein